MEFEDSGNRQGMQNFTIVKKSTLSLLLTQIQSLYLSIGFSTYALSR
jgi:hypothetical protein